MSRAMSGASPFAQHTASPLSDDSSTHDEDEPLYPHMPNVELEMVGIRPSRPEHDDDDDSEDERIAMVV